MQQHGGGFGGGGVIRCLACRGTNAVRRDCPKCQLPCCEGCLATHSMQCEGRCEAKCRHCTLQSALIKCSRCTVWICTSCIDDEYGGPICSMCALAARRTGVLPGQRQSSIPTLDELFDHASHSNPQRPPPPNVSPYPQVASTSPAPAGRPPQAVPSNGTQFVQHQSVHPYPQQPPMGPSNFVQHSPVMYVPAAQQQPQQQRPLYPPQTSNYPPPPPPLQPPQVPYQGVGAAPTFSAAGPPRPLPVPTAGGSPAPAPPQQQQPQQPPPPPRTTAAPAGMVTVMSQLPERWGRLLDQMHLAIGDCGEVFLNDSSSVMGRFVGVVNTDTGVFENGGNHQSVPLLKIGCFIKDESATPWIPPPQQQRQILMGEFIGGGAQGQVFRAKYEGETDEKIVVKVLNFKPNELALADAQEAKAKDLMSLRHEHLIQYLEVRRPKPTCVWIVMPYYKEQDMVHFLEHLQGPLNEYQLCSLILQIADALRFLHTRRPPRVHRDVKLDNILMFDNGQRTMLVDMDFSRTVSASVTGLGAMSRVGTYEYMAPEVEKGEGSTPADMWAVGIILFVLLCDPRELLIEHPTTKSMMSFNSPDWTERVLHQTLRAKAAQAAQRRRKQYSDRLVELMCGLLTREPSRRPTAEQTYTVLEEIMLGCLSSS